MVSMLRMGSAYYKGMPVRQALRSYLIDGIRISRSQKSITKFLTVSAYQGDEQIGESVVKPIAVVMREVVREMLKDGIIRGEIRPDIDLEAASRTVNVLLIALGDSQITPYLNIYFQVTDKDVAFDRTLETALDILFQGLAMKPSC